MVDFNYLSLNWFSLIPEPSTVCSPDAIKVSTVPPALLSHPESLTWNLLGSVYLPLNGDTAGYGMDMMDMTNNFACANGFFKKTVSPYNEFNEWMFLFSDSWTIENNSNKNKADRKADFAK